MKYIGYYSKPEIDNNQRGYALAATNKMEYIYSTLNKIGEDVEVVSLCGSKARNQLQGSMVKINEKTILTLFRDFGRRNRLFNYVAQILIKVRVLSYLLKHTSKNETIIVYHSLASMHMIRLLRFLKSIQLILEVEEIYGDVIGSKKISEKEQRFFQIADGYIFPTESLNLKINQNNKPNVIVHGTYHVEKDITNVYVEDGIYFDCKKIHCVYAGTFDPRKGGVFTAINATRYLPEGYHMHILGFGREEDVISVQEYIKDVSNISKAVITYDGLLSGDRYIRFIQSCDIGLSTQNPNGDFNATSFPSKILSYLANGLHVVSVRIPVVESSAIGDMMEYYDEQTPEQVAKAIMNVDVHSTYDSRKRIEQLDITFQRELMDMVGKYK